MLCFSNLQRQCCMQPLPEVEEFDPTSRPFPYPLPMDPTQRVLSNMPLLVFLPVMAAAVAGAGAVGTVVGEAAPGEHQAASCTGLTAALADCAVALHNSQLGALAGPITPSCCAGACSHAAIGAYGAHLPIAVGPAPGAQLLGLLKCTDW